MDKSTDESKPRVNQQDRQKKTQAQKEPEMNECQQYKSNSPLETMIRAYTEEKRKSEELQELLKKVQEGYDESLVRLRYMQADCENIRKRSERQIEDVKKYANESLMCDIVEVVDELEMAIKNGQDSNSSETLIQGVEMILKKIRKIMEKEGVAPIDCVLKPFDPSMHAAVSTDIREDVDEGIVLEEVRKGYMMKDKVIRPSMVKVSTKPSGSQKQEENLK